MGAGASKKTKIKEDTRPPCEDPQGRPDSGTTIQPVGPETQTGTTGQQNVLAQTPQTGQRLYPNPPNQTIQEEQKQPGQTNQRPDTSGKPQELNQHGVQNQLGQQGPQSPKGQKPPPPFNPTSQHGHPYSPGQDQQPDNSAYQKGQTPQQWQGHPNLQFQQAGQHNQQLQGGPLPNPALQQGQLSQQWQGGQPSYSTGQQNPQYGPPQNVPGQPAGYWNQQCQGVPPFYYAWQQGQPWPPGPYGPPPNPWWPQVPPNQQWPGGPPPHYNWHQGQPNQQGPQNSQSQAEQPPSQRWHGEQQPPSSWTQEPQSHEWQREQPPNPASHENPPNRQGGAPLNLDPQQEHTDQRWNYNKPPRLAWQDEENQQEQIVQHLNEGWQHEPQNPQRQGEHSPNQVPACQQREQCPAWQTDEHRIEQFQPDQPNQSSELRSQMHQSWGREQSATVQGQPNSQFAQQPNQLYERGQGSPTGQETRMNQPGQSQEETTKTIPAGVDPDVMEYVEGSSHKYELEKLMEKEQLRLQWSQGSKCATLEYIGQRNKPWQTKGVEMLQSFLTNFGKLDLAVKEEIWGDFQSKMADILASLGDNRPLVKSFEDQLTIRIVSRLCDIESYRNHLEAKMIKMYNDVTFQTETMSSVSKEHITLLKAMHFSLREKCKDLKVEMDEEKREIRLAGPKDQLNIAKMEFQRQFQAMTEKTLALDPDRLQILTTEQGQKAVKETLENGNIEAIMLFSSGYRSAKVLASSEEHAKKSASLISDLLAKEKLIVAAKRVPLTTGTPWYDYCKKIESKHEVRIRKDASGEMWIIGLKRNVEKAAKKLKYFLDHNAEMEEEFQCPSNDVREYILRRFRPELESLGVKLQEGEDSLHFNISGKQECLQKAEDLIEKLGKDVATSNVEFKQPGLKKFCESGDLDARIKEVEEREECFIRVEKNLTSMTPAGRDSFSVLTPLQSRTPSAIVPGALASTFFVTPQGQKVSWKPGDITKEQVHSLVIPQGACFNKIRSAFSPAVCQAVDELKYGEIATSSPGSSLPCNRVIHSCCSFWNGSGNSGEGTLRAVVQKSLHEVGQLGGNSIAFPIIGTGNLGFPPNEACRIMLDEAVKFYQRNQYSNVKDIRFAVFSGNKNLIDAFQTEAKKIQNQGTNTVHSPVGVNSDSIIEIVNGDLTKESTDAIVNINSTNMDMNAAGELAKAVSRASGPQVQQECTQMGPQNAGSAVMTSSGNLLVRKIIHIIPGSSDKNHLRQCLEEGLRLGDRKGLKSISIPAMGTGGYGLSATDSAQVTFQAVRNVCSSFASITKVRIVVFQASMMQAFQQEQQANSMVPTKSVPPLVAQGSPFRIDVINGDLTKESTDAIVNINSTSMDMNAAGELAKAVSRASGPQVQQECSQMGPQNAGSAVMTSSGNLLVRKIIHIIPGSSDKNHLRQCLEEGLRLADRNKLKSISIPAMGTGGYGLSATDSAQVTFQAIRNVCSSFASITKVQIVVFQASMMQAFQQEQQTYSMVPNNPVPVLAAQRSPIQQANSMVPNKSVPPPVAQGSPIRIDVINGDLTKESTDAIVNINSTSMDMNAAGELAKAVSRASGPQVQQECTQMGPQNAGSAVMTRGGNLLVRNIVHIIPGSSDKNHLRQCLEEGLRLADRNKLKSISIPAMGTGGYGLSATDSAQVTFQAIRNVCGSFLSITNVRVVVFQATMLQAFQQEKARMDTQGSPYAPSGMYQSWKPTVRVWVTGKNTTCVDKAIKAVKEIFSKACVTEKASTEDIESLTQRQINNLQREAFNCDIEIKFDQTAKCVTMRGYHGNVHKMASKIKDEINQAIKEKIQRQEDDNARAIQKMVEWSYESGGKKVVFDPKTNAKLETARTRNELKVKVTIRGKQFDIDVKNLTGRCPSDGEQLKIYRNPKEGHQGIPLPNSWSRMPSGKRVHTVKLTAGSPEYQAVEGKFRSTLSAENIVMIERIQNPLLYQTYMTRKLTLDKDIGRNSDLQLFHGTDGKNISQINSSGFNRSYCGVNGTAYGRGVYFARDASYSFRYAVGAVGSRRMYLARVLVGQYTVGNSQMIMPPPKNPINPTVLYESVVDNMANPGIFVVFHDNSCYPEYLITF